MKLLRNYIQNFLARSGSYVFFATIIARGLSFLGSWVALQLLSNKSLGIVLFAYSIVQFLIPIGGLGLHQGLIRYGALLEKENDKNSLFIYVLKKGILTSLLLIGVVILIGFLIPFKHELTNFYISILSFSIVATFIFEIVRVQFRLKHNNKSFAYTEVVYSVILVILILLLSYFFKETGYAFALVLTPLLTALLFFKQLHIDFKKYQPLRLIDFSFWKYGFFASLSNVVTQLLFVIDILLIGFLISTTETVTIYKYLTLIPFSLLFIPRVFISTDFVAFTEKITDKTYIKNYIKSYMLLFSVFSIVLILLSWVAASNILLLFGKEFLAYTDTFLILMIGVSGIFTLRGLFGNLLSSIGKSIVNYYLVSIALLINIVSNYYLIPKYGINGAAITSSVLMWLTGIASCICFIYLYKKKVSV